MLEALPHSTSNSVSLDETDTLEHPARFPVSTRRVHLQVKSVRPAVPQLFRHFNRGDLLANDLISRLLLPARKWPRRCPDLRPGDLFLVDVRHGHDFDVQVVVHMESPSVIVIHGDTEFGPVGWDVLYRGPRVHPADRLKDEDLLPKDRVISTLDTLEISLRVVPHGAIFPTVAHHFFRFELSVVPNIRVAVLLLH